MGGGLEQFSVSPSPLLVLDLIGTWLGLGLGGFGTKGFGTGHDNSQLLSFFVHSLITAALMGVDSIISLVWLWTVSEKFVKDAANTSDLSGPKIAVTEEIEIPDESGIDEAIKSMAGKFGRKKKLIH